MGGVKKLRIPRLILKRDEEPPLDRGGGSERLRRRVMAAYVATPSQEKTYPEAQPTGNSHYRFYTTFFEWLRDHQRVLWEVVLGEYEKFKMNVVNSLIIDSARRES